MAKVVSKTPTKERNARRAAMRVYKPEERKIAATLIPDSPKSMAIKVAAQRKRVEKVLRVPVADPRAQAQKQRVVSEETKKLAGLVAASKALRAKRARPVASGVVKVQAPTAKARLAAVKNEKKVVHAEIAKTEAARKKTGNHAVKAGLQTKKDLLLAKERQLQKREMLLKKGADIDKPKRVIPAKVPVQRRPLKLPPSFIPPTKSEVITATHVLTAAVKPEPGESEKERQIRIRGLLERVLARHARNRALLGKESSQALKEAVEETIAADKPVIDLEIKASGGLVQDPAAEVMEVFVDEVADEVATASTSVSPPVPAADPTPEQVIKVVEAAQHEEVVASSAPKEVSDELREDLILADEDVADVPFYRQPVVIVGGTLLAAGLFYLATRS